jgi:hypothetical protein
VMNEKAPVPKAASLANATIAWLMVVPPE